MLDFMLLFVAYLLQNRMKCFKDISSPSHKNKIYKKYIYTEPLGIALSYFKSDHHSNHSFDDLNNIIWYVCQSNMKVYKSDPKYRLKRNKNLPRLSQGVRNIKRELKAAFNQWKDESQ